MLLDDYINPFDIKLDKNILYNLSSSAPIPNTIADKLVSLPSEGISMAKDFMQNRLYSRTVLFHEHIKRNIKKSDLQTKKTSCSKQKENTVAEVNRDILGVLVSYDQLSEEKIDYKEALKYPLSPIPQSLSHADGFKRSNKKSQVNDIIAKHRSSEFISPPCGNSSVAYIVDIMALIRTFKTIPDTYESLAWKITKSVPPNCARVDLVADSYDEILIKASERQCRGFGDRVEIKSAQLKIPANFQSFLRNSQNKSRMVEIVFKVIMEKRVKFLIMKKTN